MNEENVSTGRMDNKELLEQLRDELTQALSSMRDVGDEQLLEMIDAAIDRAEKVNYLPNARKLFLRNTLFDSFRRLDVLQELVDRKDVTEIMINGCDDIFIEKNGKTVKWEKTFATTEQLEDMIQQIVAKVNRTVNVSSPICDARLEDGSRVNIVLPPIALNGPVITIRKFPEPITMEKLIGWNAISREAAAFLRRLVRAGYNIFICGGTNSGKTTFLNALSSFIPEAERVITIEDSAELQLTHIKNLVRMETRMPNAQGEGAVTMGDLIRASLRMNPDRIVVGEVRGAEALDMLQAMNTGHDGSLSTGHGNSPKDMLSRIETMVLSGAELPVSAIRGQMAGAIDIMVHLGRLRDRSRRVLSIVEVGEYEEGSIRLEPIYEFRESLTGSGEEGTDKKYGKNSKIGSGGAESEGEQAGKAAKRAEKKEEVRGELVKVGRLRNTRKLLAAGDGLQNL
jgi:pilus assembly protein CpaF